MKKIQTWPGIHEFLIQDKPCRPADVTATARNWGFKKLNQALQNNLICFGYTE